MGNPRQDYSKPEPGGSPELIEAANIAMPIVVNDGRIRGYTHKRTGKTMKPLRPFVLTILMFLSGPGFAGDENSQNTGVVFVCEEPRPQVCTMDYRPVCGNLSDGGVKTYSNGCGACGDAKVISWVEGECPK
jgi:hypothetical protein